MLIVIALGGNALLRRGEPADQETQRKNVATAAAAIAAIAEQHDIVVTHGNGPQIGILADQALTETERPGISLDMLGAETEGMIGYVIERELANCLPGRTFATLLTQVVVDPKDQVFSSPAKPIGPILSSSDAHRLAKERGWHIVKDGDGYRRAVASPAPLAIRELGAIKTLVDAGVIVICAGGGGVPVHIGEDGAIRGVEAVIDKDHSAALLAIELRADALLILTDVHAVLADWGKPHGKAIREATPETMSTFEFEAGTMNPKVEAACRFVEATGGFAGIGDIAEASAILQGEAGTKIRSANST